MIKATVIWFINLINFSNKKDKEVGKLRRLSGKVLSTSAAGWRILATRVVYEHNVELKKSSMNQEDVQNAFNLIDDNGQINGSDIPSLPS